MLSRPRTALPAANAPSSFTRNQVPNSVAFVRARHTRVRGARSTTRFSIRSVLLVSLGVSVLTAMGGCLRNQEASTHGSMPPQPGGKRYLDRQQLCCISYQQIPLNATPRL